jgi:exonuclease III
LASSLIRKGIHIDLPNKISRGVLGSFRNALQMHGASREQRDKFAQGWPHVEGRIMYVSFHSFDLLSLYAPTSSTTRWPDRPEFDEILLAFLRARRSLTERPLLCCGDLNVAPARADSTHEKVFDGEPGYGFTVTDNERTRFSAALEEFGLVDIWRELNPAPANDARPALESPSYTWRCQAKLSPHEDVAQRLDYFLAPAAWHQQRVARCEILGHGTTDQRLFGFLCSDHAPVQLTLHPL